jgi:hypothetical protein
MQYTQYVTQMYASPHSTEHDMIPTAFLISKQVVPYWTRGGTCCSEVSTPKIRSIADLSTTCHDGIKYLHPSNHAQTKASILTRPNHITTDGRPNSHMLEVIKCIYLPPTYLHFMQDKEDRCLLQTSSTSFIDQPF